MTKNCQRVITCEKETHTFEILHTSVFYFMLDKITDIHQGCMENFVMTREFQKFNTISKSMVDRLHLTERKANAFINLES